MRKKRNNYKGNYKKDIEEWKCLVSKPHGATAHDFYTVLWCPWMIIDQQIGSALHKIYNFT